MDISNGILGPDELGICSNFIGKLQPEPSFQKGKDQIPVIPMAHVDFYLLSMKPISEYHSSKGHIVGVPDLIGEFHERVYLSLVYFIEVYLWLFLNKKVSFGLNLGRVFAIDRCETFEQLSLAGVALFE